MKKTILITGGAGFIGSNLIRYISYNRNTYNIISLDKIKDIASLHNVYLNKGNEFYLADINDEHILDNIFRMTNPNIVIHLANDNNLNFNGISNLHKVSNKYKVEKFVYLSSSSFDIYTNEDFSCFCIDNYITSKLFNVNYNIIRIPKCFGPRQNIFNIIPDLFLSFIKQDKVILANKGVDVYDLLYVEDLCQAILTVMENGKDNEIYNASINLDYTELELAAIIRDFLITAKDNKRLDYNIGNISLDDDSIESIKNLFVDSSKLKELGWKPERKFKENLKYTINWYINNKWFFNI